MTDDRQARITEANERLKEILLRHVPRPAVLPGPVDGVFLVRREAVNCSESCFTRPLASLIVQGSKQALLGSREYTIRADQCLVAAVDMPSLSHAVDPTPERPFLSLFFHLDRQMLGELLMEMTPEERAVGVDDSGVSVADADPDLMEGVLRLAELLDKPRQIAVRAPLIMRELHYLLLIGPLGHVLRGLYAQGSQNSQVLQAVSILRRDLGAPVRMESLARQVGMSLSTLHRHFKTVTGLSPLQYLKQLRLHEAQRLMLMEDMRAASAALSVGYESVTQFSREYKRMFGEPPHRDIQRKRTLAPLGEDGLHHTGQQAEYFRLRRAIVKPEGDHRGLHFRRREEHLRRHQLLDLNRIPELSPHRKRPVLLRAGRGGEPLAHFALKHEEHLSRRVRKIEHPGDEDRADRIGQIGDGPERFSGRQEFLIIHPAGVRLGQMEVLMRQILPQIVGDPVIEFDRINLRPALQQPTGQGAEAGTDFKDDLPLLRLPQPDNRVEQVPIE